MQWIAVSFAAFLVWLNHQYHAIPANTLVTMQVAGMLVMLDTFAGAMLAMRTGRLRSRSLRMGLVSKCTQYTLFVGLGGCVKLLVASWLPLQWAFAGIIMIEAVSIFENINRFSALDGLNLGPAQPFLRALKAIFEVEAGEKTERAKDSKDPKDSKDAKQ